jgi:hypothetical protein
MLAFLLLLALLAQLQQHIGAMMSVAPIYWCNCASSTNKLVQTKGENLDNWCCSVSSTNNHVVMCTVFVHFFIFRNVFTHSGLNNEEFIEPHAFLMANDLAPHPPPAPSVSSTGETLED